MINEHLSILWRQIEPSPGPTLDDVGFDELLAAEAAQPLDAGKGPVVAAGLYTLTSDRHLLVITASAACADGESLVILARELAAASEGIGRERRVVLVVDQFEELFTACTDEHERSAFIDALARERTDRQAGPVVLAIRADFYGRCAEYPALSDLLGANQLLVGPMRRDELRRAIELPAQRVGLRVDPELVEALVGDVADEPGSLPLLSTSLLQLWQRGDGRRLRHADYEGLGGVHGAVARLAEDAFGRLDPSQQTVARRVLLRLAGEGAGGEEHEPEHARVVSSVAPSKRRVALHLSSVERPRVWRNW